MDKKHYSKECGCKYTEGDPKPWYVCVDHFSSQHEPMKHFRLYALKLKDGKYYVGMTAKRNPYDRIRSHGSFLGARWTMVHQPIEVMEVKDIGYVTSTEAERQEQELTLTYMKEYGYKNVRGGSVTYTGQILKVGNWFFRGYQIEQLFVGVLLMVIGIYLVFVA